MPASKAQQKAVNKYVKANYDLYQIKMPKGKKDDIKAAAAAAGESVNAYINTAITQRMERDPESVEWPLRHLMENRLFECIQAASVEERQLIEKVFEFGELFTDMTFSEGTPTHELIACKSQISGSDEWIDDEVAIPDELEYFSYDSFTFHIKGLGDTLGTFNSKEFSVTISPECSKQDDVILHEMIHLHEFVVNNLPMFFHDAILFCIYKDLKSKIPDLDERIEGHGHILNSSLIARQGGIHDILFLLKSFDLDLKMGYKLGTVFGYGMTDSLEPCKITSEAAETQKTKGGKPNE